MSFAGVKMTKMLRYPFQDGFQRKCIVTEINARIDVNTERAQVYSGATNFFLNA